MNQSFGAVRVSLGWLAAVVVAMSMSASAQQGSLADAARQARAGKQGPTQSTSNRAQEIADELSEDQNDTGAPGGFKTFNEGDYQVWVPSPFTVEGHDSAGIVLTGPSVGTKKAMVLVGNALATHWENNENAFHDAATQFTRLYDPSSQCAKTTMADHPAYQCGLAGANLLGHRVSGNAMFVRVSALIYPIFCVAPTDSRERDILNDPLSSYSDKMYARANLAHEEADVRSVWEKCNSVFQSFRMKEGAKATAAAASASNKSASPKASRNESAQNPASSASAEGARAIPVPPSIAPAAAPTVQAPVAQNALPEGFKAHSFQYCKSHTQQCWNVSVSIPAEAKLVSSDCKQYIFETRVQGSPLFLMAGSTGNECENHGNTPDPVSWHQLVDPESKRAPGTFSTISSLTSMIDGKAAAVITIGFRKGLSEWMGKRAEVENSGTQVVVGCVAEREHFADGDAICSALIGSLRVQ